MLIPTYADQGLNKIPDTVTDEQALFAGDVLATGDWAAQISEVKGKDTVLIIGQDRQVLALYNVCGSRILSALLFVTSTKSGWMK